MSGLRCALWAQVTKPAGTSPHPHCGPLTAAGTTPNTEPHGCQRRGAVHFPSIITNPAPLDSQGANHVLSLLKVPLVKLRQVQKMKKLWKEQRPNTETWDSHEHALSYCESRDTRPGTEREAVLSVRTDSSEAGRSSTYCAASTSASGLLLNCSRQYIKT